MNVVTLKSNDIHCDGCAASITKAVSALAGVTLVHVDIAQQTVHVTFEEPATEQRIAAAMDEAGFEVTAA